MFSLHISTAGMRELHWHPRTSEMGYVVRGRARMTILSPDGSVDTFTLQSGDVYFVPAAYPHQIENINEDAGEEIFFLIFFDRETPQDIGYTAGVPAYSRQVLAASLQCDVDELPSIPFEPKDLMIVKRINPVAD
jgi:oxalate decarboxylase